MKAIIKNILICAVLVAVTGCGAARYASSSRLPEISGHRGANDIAPENTLASADSCIRYGIDVMECDVTVSKDGVFYVLHDYTLDRTTNGSGYTYEHPASYLETLDAGSWFGEAWKGQKLLKFQDLLKRAKKNGLDVTVDYRKGDFKDLVALIKKEGMLKRTYFTFSKAEDCIEFRRLFPKVKTLQGYANTIEEVDLAIEQYQPNIIVCWVENMNQEFVDYCHKRGCKVLALVLGMDDKTADNRKAVELGVDVVATDRPKDFKNQFNYGK